MGKTTFIACILVFDYFRSQLKLETGYVANVCTAEATAAKKRKIFDEEDDSELSGYRVIVES